jgi:dihydrofolate reductase
MRKLVVVEHVSLDGFLATPDGGIGWVHVDDEIWDFVEPAITACDTAIYGRKTYEMMAAYWPTAADEPDASQHDLAHSRWVANATKLVFSRTLDVAPWGSQAPATLVREDPANALRRSKQAPGGDMVLLGSASIAHALIREALVDDYYLAVNPVLLGGGLPMFPTLAEPQSLKLEATRKFTSGVVGLHYSA